MRRRWRGNPLGIDLAVLGALAVVFALAGAWSFERQP